MDIGYHVVEALIREAKYCPLTGDVISIGRQTIYFSPDQILHLLKEHGLDTHGRSPSDLETGGPSNVDLPEYDGRELITDR
jgi:hypothetical protein